MYSTEYIGTVLLLFAIYFISYFLCPLGDKNTNAIPSIDKISLSSDEKTWNR
jgi:hypothetical protein